MKYSYSKLAKIRFYMAYLGHKLMVPLEVRQPRLHFAVYEAMYTTCKFLDYYSQLAYPFHEEVIVTRFGKFAIQRGTSDAAGISPAYERSDVNYLLALTGRLLARGRRVLFLDIGADIGMFSTTMLNRFPSPALRVAAFEPMPRSFSLLRRNLDMNGHKEGGRVKIFNCAVGQQVDERVQIYFDPTAPGSSGAAHSNATNKQIEVEGQTLDKLVFDQMETCDDVIMKIDVEGMEIAVLKGAERILASGRGVYLMIEDFVEPAILAYLESSPLRFLAKRTDYNSWWTTVPET